MRLERHSTPTSFTHHSYFQSLLSLTSPPLPLPLRFPPPDVLLVTSLRDGMNLVSYEFVACQNAKTGVLILSEVRRSKRGEGRGGEGRGMEWQVWRTES